MGVRMAGSVYVWAKQKSESEKKIDCVGEWEWRIVLCVREKREWVLASEREKTGVSQILNEWENESEYERSTEIDFFQEK